MLQPRSLAQAQTIRAQVDSRYRRVQGRKLAITEASSTANVESFLLLTRDLLGIRVVPAADGIFYAICPVGAICPYPGPRFARPATDLASLRAALELALRTFRRTPATVVAVSLPTPRPVYFIVERGELEGDVDARLFARVAADPARTPAPWVRRLIVQATRERLFLILGLEPTPSGVALGGVPLWPAGAAVSPAASGGQSP